MCGGASDNVSGVWFAPPFRHSSNTFDRFKAYVEVQCVSVSIGAVAGLAVFGEEKRKSRLPFWQRPGRNSECRKRQPAAKGH